MAFISNVTELIALRNRGHSIVWSVESNEQQYNEGADEDAESGDVEHDDESDFGLNFLFWNEHFTSSSSLLSSPLHLPVMSLEILFASQSRNLIKESGKCTQFAIRLLKLQWNGTFSTLEEVIGISAANHVIHFHIITTCSEEMCSVC